MWKPINRTRVQVSDNKFRIYDKRAPLFYKKPDGTYDDIDHTFNDTTSTIGDISLMNKGVVSVGKRKGNNPQKVVGIRPDSNQHLGTQQLEFSLVNVELDGESQDFNVEDDLEIKLRAAKVMQLVKLHKIFNDCKIEFDIHAKGLELQNKKYTENKVIRDYGFNLTNLGDIDTSATDLTLNGLFGDDKDIPYIDGYVCKITNDHLTTGEYSNTEEFGDSDISNYVLDNDLYNNGSGMYYKDSLIFVAKTYNIEDYENIIANNIADMYGCSLLKNDENHSEEEYMDGYYFIKDKKKIGGYFSQDNIFLAFINTKDISDEIKSLFKRKTFQDTSYMDISLDDFYTSLNNRFNKDLKIEVDSSYYEGDMFEFKIKDESFFIKEPIAFDENYKNLFYETTHTLTDNPDGSYRYTKYLKCETALNVNNAKYLDATLSVSHAEDMGLYKSYSSTTGLQKTSSNFDNAREVITAGTAVYSDADAEAAEAYGVAVAGDYGVKVTTGGKTVITTWEWYLFQTPFHFDCSGVTDTVSSLEFKTQSAYRSYDASSQSIPEDISVIILKANLNAQTFNTYNWNDYIGFGSGWDSDDTTEYSSEYVVDGVECVPSAFNLDNSPDNPSDYVSEDIPLNSTAKTDLQNENDLEFILLDYDQFYLDSYDSSYGTNTSTGEGRRMFMHQVDSHTTSERPYLEYTTGEAETVTYNSNFFGANF
jgi:hypothetical protein